MSQLEGLMGEYVRAMESWKSAAAAGNSDQGQAQVDDVLRRWRDFAERLQAGSLTAATGVMEQLSAGLQEVAELRDTLADLQAQAVTRTEQATSVNPKVTASPYVNILGLQRTFRDSTRQGLLIASIVLGILALGALGFLTVAFVTRSGLGQLVSGNLEGAGQTFQGFTSYKA
jgi:hypothetical protein